MLLVIELYIIIPISIKISIKFKANTTAAVLCIFILLVFNLFLI